MKSVRRLFYPIYFILLLPFLANPAQGQWSHIELGAANYGLEGNSVDIDKGGISEFQHDLLYKTVEKLISSKGTKGTFYLNDIDEEAALYASANLEKYLKAKHPGHGIVIEPLVGNFFEMDLPKVDSIHLKNPEYWFYEGLMDGKNRNRLAYFADRSREGLTLVTYFKRPFLHRLTSQKVGYKILNEEFPPYFNPNGEVITKFGNSIEFLVKSVASIREEGKDLEKAGFVTRYEAPRNYLKESIMYDLFEKELAAREFLHYVDPKFVPSCGADL